MYHCNKLELIVNSSHPINYLDLRRAKDEPKHPKEIKRTSKIKTTERDWLATVLEKETYQQPRKCTIPAVLMGSTRFREILCFHTKNRIHIFPPFHRIFDSQEGYPHRHTHVQLHQRQRVFDLHLFCIWLRLPRRRVSGCRTMRFVIINGTWIRGCKKWD